MNYAKLLTDIEYVLDMVREIPIPQTDMGRNGWLEAEHVLQLLRTEVMLDIAKFEVIKND